MKTRWNVLTVPNFLSAVRLGLAPVLLWPAWNGYLQIYVLGLSFSLVTDVLDGLFARWLRQATDFGAQLDSWADFATMVSIPICVWWLRPEAVRNEAPFVGLGLIGYGIPVVAGLLKYKRLTSYHTWAGKAAAVIVGPAVILLLLTELNWVFECAMVVALVAGSEEVAITVVLKEWRPNVPSVWHALRLNRQPKP